MRFSKLFNDDGERTDEPELVPTSISWDAKNGHAQAWTPDGMTLIAEMHEARVTAITMRGIHIDGMEPTDLTKKRFRVMSWFVKF